MALSSFSLKTGDKKSLSSLLPTLDSIQKQKNKNSNINPILNSPRLIEAAETLGINIKIFKIMKKKENK